MRSFSTILSVYYPFSCSFTSEINTILRWHEELKKADEISPTILKAIETSDISIIIFAKDYASSKWWLNELVKILDCKKMNGQIVIPVFFQVDPSDVRKQRGSFGAAFVRRDISTLTTERKTHETVGHAAVCVVVLSSFWPFSSTHIVKANRVLFLVNHHIDRVHPVVFRRLVIGNVHLDLVENIVQTLHVRLIIVLDLSS